MDKREQLFIRACKSNSSQFRLKRLYQKFYYSKYSDHHLMLILVEICEKYCPFTVSDILVEVSPAQHWVLNYSKTEYDFYSHAIRVLTNKIKFSKKDCFTGLTAQHILGINHDYC